MGNPQVRLSREFKLGWLVAALEGEGSISLAWSRRKDGYIQILPRVNIVNKEQGFVDRAIECAAEFEIPIYVTKNKHDLLQVQWNGMKRVKKLLVVVTPYLCIKKERAEAVLDFVEYRLTRKHKRQPYGQVEKDLFLKVRRLNGAGRLDEDDLRLAFESNLNGHTSDTDWNPFLQ